MSVPGAMQARELAHAGVAASAFSPSVAIAAINAFNRVNVATRQISGEWVDQIAQQSVAEAA